MPCDNGAFWTSKDGDIRYHDLEDRHLGNIIRMLERQIKEAEGAFYGSEHELDRFNAMVAEKQEQLGDLLAEQERRTKLPQPSKQEELDRMTAESAARIEKRTAAFKRRNRRRES